MNVKVICPLLLGADYCKHCVYELVAVCALLTEAQIYFERTTKCITSDLLSVSGKVKISIKCSYNRVAVELVSCRPLSVAKSAANDLLETLCRHKPTSLGEANVAVDSGQYRQCGGLNYQRVGACHRLIDRPAAKSWGTYSSDTPPRHTTLGQLHSVTTH